MAASAHELRFGLEVFGALLDRQLDADEGDARACAHAVGDGLFEAVSVADASEVGEQQVGDRVIGTLERCREAEAFVVLSEQRAPEDPAAEAVTLVGDQESAPTR